jgi:WXG100 family type VII secretion target
MAGQIGMDAGVVRQCATAIDTSAQQLDRLVGSVDGVVSSIGSDWQGDDAAQFHEIWGRTHKPALTTLVAALRTFAATAQRNAGAQETASSAAGSTNSAGTSSGSTGGDRGPDYEGLLKSAGTAMGFPSALDDASKLLFHSSMFEDFGGQPFAALGIVATGIGVGTSGYDAYSDFRSGNTEAGVEDSIDGAAGIVREVGTRLPPEVGAEVYAGGVIMSEYTDVYKDFRAVDWSQGLPAPTWTNIKQDYIPGLGIGLKGTISQAVTWF